jgi:molybdopterin synthase catalytic subunit
MATVRVQPEAFDVGAEIAALTAGRSDIGGIGCFIGTVRDAADGRGIVAMTLEHYPGMTERAMAAIAAEAEKRWGLLGCRLVHRVGRLLPGEAIVLVLAASAHRQAALDATAFLIDWLKTRAPFWKKEEFSNGAAAWVAAREDDVEAAARWNAGLVGSGAQNKKAAG